MLPERKEPRQRRVSLTRRHAGELVDAVVLERDGVVPREGVVVGPVLEAPAPRSDPALEIGAGEIGKELPSEVFDVINGNELIDECVELLGVEALEAGLVKSREDRVVHRTVLNRGPESEAGREIGVDLP
jgi:hypothetical protein